METGGPVSWDWWGRFPRTAGSHTSPYTHSGKPYLVSSCEKPICALAWLTYSGPRFFGAWKPLMKRA